jgi:hypothetical protein
MVSALRVLARTGSLYGAAGQLGSRCSYRPGDRMNGASYSSHFQARQMGTSCIKSVWDRSSQTLLIHHSFAVSLDHLVSAGQECLRNRETERLDGRQIDHEFELGRLLDGKVSGFRTFEYFVDKIGCMAELVRVV